MLEASQECLPMAAEICSAYTSENVRCDLSPKILPKNKYPIKFCAPFGLSLFNNLHAERTERRQSV